MKRVLLVLMCMGLVSMAQALQITNGDFEADAGGGSVEAVSLWYDDTSTNFYESAWQTDNGAITPNGTQVIVFCSWNTVEEEPLTGSYVYQSIGTSAGETTLDLRFDWGHPDDVGAGRLDGITVSAWTSDGTFVPGDGVDINGAAGVTLLDSASFTHTSEGTDGEIWSVDVTLDISGASAGDEIFLRFNNYQPVSGDPWPVLDNVELLTIVNISPPDGATLIPPVLTDAENDLVFDVIKSTIVDVEVYFSANDPNVPDLLTTIPAAGTGQHTVTLEELPSDLTFETTYYWQAVGYEPNDLDGGALTNKVAGPVWSFTTAPDAPAITVDPPAYTAVDAGEPTLVLAANGINGTFQWYKDGTPLADGADYQGVTTENLQINDVQLDDEGYYTIKVSNDPLEDESTPARVMIHRQTSYYDFESVTALPDGNDVFVDSIDGYDAMRVQTGASAGLPASVTDANSIPGLGAYVYISNEDNATDPNAQYLQILPGVSSYEDITISFWVQATSVSAWSRILDFGNGQSDYMFITSDDADGYDPRFVIGGQDNEQILEPTAIDSSNWIGPGTGWHFVAVTVGGDSGKFYYDGEWYVTNANMTFDPIDVDTVLNYIGKSQYAVDPYFSGYIDDLKIYNYARTNVQIAQDYLTVAGSDFICDWEGWNADGQMMDVDSDDDCDVDLVDFAYFAERWLDDIYQISLP